MSRFTLHVGEFDTGNESVFELPHVAPEDLTGSHIKEAIYGRCGVKLAHQHILVMYHGLFDKMELKDDDVVNDLVVNDQMMLMRDADDLNFVLVFSEGLEAPFTKVPDAEDVVIVPTSEIVDRVVRDSLPPLLPPIEHTFTIGGATSPATIGSVVDTLFPTICSEVVTSVRGSVVVSDRTTTASHVVYPFVFRAGGKDMRAMWAAELRERLGASVHPVTLGRDVYQSALQLLDDSPSPSAVTWELTVSISCRPTTS